jgi:vacuolar protein sorting-associated protein 3
LIEDQGCDDSHYHTSYALLLPKSALEAVHKEAKYGGKDDKENDCAVMFIYSLREWLQLLLQASDLYDPEEVLDMIAEYQPCLEKVMSSFIFVLVTVPYVPGLASLQ